jgi:protein-tyrosine-phosphatase
MAEAIARRDASDVIEPVSAGIAPLWFVAEATKETLVANGIPADHLSSKELSEELWTSADLVINMTGRPSKVAFRWVPDRGDVEDWQIQDPYGADSAVYQKTCEDLRRRILALAERLRKMAPQASEKA